MEAIRSICRPLFVTSICLACLATVAFAVGNDKALYVGGTIAQFAPPQVGRAEAVAGALLGGVAPPPKIEGRINLASASELRFDAGSRGSLVIRYDAITSAEYGLEAGRRTPKGKGLLLIPRWDPTEQFTKNAHNLLTLVYQDQAEIEQAVVLELGKDLVRPTLQALERGTGQAVEFLNVEACMLFRSNADACNYGQPGELKGLKRVFVDTSIPVERRNLVLSEIENGNAGLEMMEVLEGAEIILSYHSQESFDPNCPCTGGRGEVRVVRADHQRVVLVFMGVKRGFWGKNPAEDFGMTFVDAFRSANGLERLRR
jgi:hypothetical protein